MSDPRYLKDFVEEMLAEGEASFALRHCHPVLVGIGVAGELGDRQPKRRSQTIGVAEVDLASIAVDAATLRSRVWAIRKAGPRGVDATAITVGRIAGNDVVVPEYSISEHHCAFRWQASRLVLTDLGSLNGTVLESTRLAPFIQAPIDDGARIALGRFQFQFLTAKGFLRHVTACGDRRHDVRG